MIIPNELRIFFISSREKKLCPCFYFHWFRDKFISIFGIYFSYFNFFKFVPMGFVVEDRICDYLYIFFMSFLYSLNEFFFCSIFSSRGSLLVKFSKVKQIVNIITY